MNASEQIPWYKRAKRLIITIAGIITFFITVAGFCYLLSDRNRENSKPTFKAENHLVDNEHNIVIIKPTNSYAQKPDSLNIEIGGVKFEKRGIPFQDTSGRFWQIYIPHLNLSKEVFFNGNHKLRVGFSDEDMFEVSALIFAYRNEPIDTIDQNQQKDLPVKNFQAKDKPDKQSSNSQPNVSVTSNNQSGGVTAYQVSIYEKEPEPSIQEILVSSLDNINPLILDKLKSQSSINVFIKTYKLDKLYGYFEAFSSARLIFFQPTQNIISGNGRLIISNTIYDIDSDKNSSDLEMYVLHAMDSLKYLPRLSK